MPWKGNQRRIPVTAFMPSLTSAPGIDSSGSRLPLRLRAKALFSFTTTSPSRGRGKAITPSIRPRCIPSAKGLAGGGGSEGGVIDSGNGGAEAETGGGRGVGGAGGGGGGSGEGSGGGGGEGVAGAGSCGAGRVAGAAGAGGTAGAGGVGRGATAAAGGGGVAAGAGGAGGGTGGGGRGGAGGVTVPRRGLRTSEVSRDLPTVIQTGKASGAKPGLLAPKTWRPASRWNGWARRSVSIGRSSRV